ncbi:MAG: pyruvate ferredoxin oxidoreductase [Gammaproteobacteria bacterium]|nr:pyruvate ferredoxin oxidoreductase [Gammaproteobacteria bacterium]
MNILRKGNTRKFKYPGTRMAVDGNTAVIMCEREASDAAGAYPITPSTQMGEYWAEEAANGHLNTSGRPLVFVEPESEHAAAAVTAGMAMTGMRATNFTSAQGAAFMHESLYAAVGKRLPYVLNLGCRAITKASLNVHCGHDDYHCVDDTGFVQVFAKNAQEAADLNLIGHRIAELSLTPAVVGQDGFLTTHLIEPVMIPERELIDEYLGYPDDMIDCPTPAQTIVYGPKRRRIPEVWSVDSSLTSGTVQNQDAYMQATAAQRPYFFEHIRDLSEQAMSEYYELTGREYSRLGSYRMDDAEYVILGQGSVMVQIEAVIDYLRKTRKLKLGAINMTMFRPFPGDMLGKLLKGKKGITVFERTDQPLAEDLPLMRETRATISKCIENGLAASRKTKKSKSAESGLAYPAYESYQTRDVPSLYSACYGLGSRDLQPEGIIAAFENMLADGKQKRFFYLGIDFHREAGTPKQEVHLNNLIEHYPELPDLALKGSENPDLQPKGAITVRMHSVGGWGAITTGKNLAMTLYDLLGYDIRANPKYGSEKKGQPTTYYLSAAPEPIRLNCEYNFVDVVLSPDPNVFTHSNPVSGLKPGGAFIIQSNLSADAEVWARIPPAGQKYIVENNIRVFYIDGFKIAKEEASNPELQYRMQGNAFQGAFFAASPLLEAGNLTEEGLFEAIEKQLRDKFGDKGEKVIEDNLRVVRRGFDGTVEIKDKPLGIAGDKSEKQITPMPIMLKQLPKGAGLASDIHRFWAQVGSFYKKGEGDATIADPFMATGLMPAATGVYRDMTAIRFEYPEFIADNCTACGNCYTVCPDSAIPGLVNTFAEVFNTAILDIETGGQPTNYLRREVRNIEKRMRTMIDARGDGANVSSIMDQAILELLAESELGGNSREMLEKELALLSQFIGDFRFSITKPYYSTREKKNKGSGGLFSVTINPYTCKGCMECVTVCDDDALLAEPQTDAAIERMKNEWELWTKLPTTQPDFIRIDDIDEKIGALDTLLLDKTNYNGMVSGDGACMGCGEKTVIHLFTGTVTAMMQPRVAEHVRRIDDLTAKLETHLRMKLAENIDLSQGESLKEAIDAHKEDDLTLGKLTASMEAGNKFTPIDQEWLTEMMGLLDQLRHLKWLYTAGETNAGRANMGFINATGCTSVWGSTFPYSPYPFPWTNNLFQDSPSVAMGIFEGHMAKMADSFKLIRRVELELAGKYDSAEHDAFLTYFDWNHFSDDEWKLCPPVVAVGGDGAMYDIGFQNLSRALASGMPIKALVLDTQVYSNTGGQACTSGFISQVADMSPYGKVHKGKEEQRKEISLIGMAHRTAFVLQSTQAHVTHLLEGFIDGLNSRRPALFNIYATCQPEHGVGDDMSDIQSKLVVDSRAYPLFRYDPDEATSLAEAATLDGNHSIEEDWISYEIKYEEDGVEKSLNTSLTFADFAFTEGRFRKQFKPAPAETWNDDMMPLIEFLDLSEDDREGLFPYIWAVDDRNHLMRILVSAEMVASCEERLTFWQQLKSLTRDDVVIDEKSIKAQAKAEAAQQLTSGLINLALNGDISAIGSVTLPVTTAGGNGAAVPAAAEGFEPVWIETPECTACDECTDINPAMFAYNEEGLAYVKDPTAGSFLDIVKSAEKCTAECLHPGTPFNPDEKNVEKLIQRAAKFQ